MPDLDIRRDAPAPSPVACMFCGALGTVVWKWPIAAGLTLTATLTALPLPAAVACRYTAAG